MKNTLNHQLRNMLENIEQNLIELMADYLDSEILQIEQAIALVKDPVTREESELHIRMAKAAFLEYKKTIVDENGSSTCH
jgi:hypothetical protein